MIKGTADESSVKRAALFAYAAGATGILANPLLIAFYALQASHPEDGTSPRHTRGVMTILAKTRHRCPTALLAVTLGKRSSGRVMTLWHLEQANRIEEAVG